MALFMIRITSGENAGLFLSTHIFNNPDWQKYIKEYNAEGFLAVADNEVFVLRKGKGINFFECPGKFGTEYIQAKLKALGVETELVKDSVVVDLNAELDKAIAERNWPTVANPRPLRD